MIEAFGLLDLPLIWSAIIIDLGVTDLIELGNGRQLFDFDALVLHSPVIRYKIPSDAQVPLEFGDVLERLSSQ